MENFILNSEFNKQEFIEASLIRWEICWFKNKQGLFLCSIMSFTLLGLGFLLTDEEEIMNPFIFIGTFLFLITCFMVYNRISTKSKYVNDVKEVAEKFDLLKMDCSYEFSDEYIKYTDKEKVLELKWSVFTNYSLYKNHLVIILNNSLTNTFIFKKEHLTIDEYEKIFDFVKSKLKLKEIR